MNKIILVGLKKAITLCKKNNKTKPNKTIETADNFVTTATTI